jgi:hypothetical protein
VDGRRLLVEHVQPSVRTEVDRSHTSELLPVVAFHVAQTIRIGQLQLEPAVLGRQ